MIKTAGMGIDDRGLSCLGAPVSQGDNGSAIGSEAKKSFQYLLGRQLRAAFWSCTVQCKLVHELTAL